MFCDDDMAIWVVVFEKTHRFTSNSQPSSKLWVWMPKSPYPSPLAAGLSSPLDPVFSCNFPHLAVSPVNDPPLLSHKRSPG